MNGLLDTLLKNADLLLPDGSVRRDAEVGIRRRRDRQHCRQRAERAARPTRSTAAAICSRPAFITRTRIRR